MNQVQRRMGVLFFIFLLFAFPINYVSAIEIKMDSGEGAFVGLLFLMFGATNQTTIYISKEFNITICYINLDPEKPIFVITKAFFNETGGFSWGTLEYYLVNGTKILKFGEVGLDPSNSLIWVEWLKPDFSWNRQEWTTGGS